MLGWPAAAGFGAVGGAIVEAIELWKHLRSWQAARRRALRAQRSLPPLSEHIDPVADTAVALTRVVLGALAGLAFHGEVGGATAAITVGASAPALLTQLGSATTIASIRRTGGEEEREPGLTEVA